MPNPSDPAFNIVGGDPRVDGGQLEAKGQITRALDVDASYTYLDGRVMRTTPGGPLLGAPLTNAPRNTSSLWVDYRVTHPLHLGVGALQASSQLGQDTAAACLVAPGYVIWNAMARYAFSPTCIRQAVFTMSPPSPGAQDWHHSSGFRAWSGKITGGGGCSTSTTAFRDCAGTPPGTARSWSSPRSTIT